MVNIPFIIGESLRQTIMTLIAFLPSILWAGLLLLAGFVFGSILGRAAAHLVTVLRVDAALRKVGVEKISERAGLTISVAGFFGGIIKWTLVIAFALSAAEVLGLSQLTQLLNDVLLFIPQVLIAAVMLIVAALLGDFVARLIDHSVKATGMKAHVAAQLAKWAIIVIGGIFPALIQLNIAPALIQVLFTGVVFALSLALGLAFGLGGKEAAAKAIEKMKQN